MVNMHAFSQIMLETLVNDLMDLAKLESQSFKLHKTYFNPLQSIHNVFQVMLSSANQRGINLVLQVPSHQDLLKV